MSEPGNNKEFSQVRSQIDKAIERQDNYFLSTFTLLGIGNIFQNAANIYFGVVVLCVSWFLIMKIIECRNMVFYNTTYLMVFIENADEKLLYETRVQNLRKIFWMDNNFLISKKIYRKLYKFGYYTKNGIVCVFALLLSLQMIISIVPLDNPKAIIKFIAISVVTFLNVIYTIMLMNDRFLTKEFYEKCVGKFNVFTNRS